MHDPRTRAGDARLGTMYDEGACLMTPALESIERARQDAAERQVAAGLAPRGPIREAIASLRRIAERIAGARG